MGKTVRTIMKKISDNERIEITERALHVFLKNYDMHFKVDRVVLKDPYDSRPALRIDGDVNPYWMRTLLDYFVVEYVYLNSIYKIRRSLVITSLRDLSKFNEIFNETKD